MDNNLLRQLGWSDELIAEVTRMSANLQSVADSLQTVPYPVKACSVASSSIHFHADDMTTGIQLHMPE